MKFNRSLKSGDVPVDWLHSYLAVLAKPGKDHTKISGYRIITMQNTVGKLLEKIVSRNVAKDLEERQILPPTLGSYRRGKDTWANAAIFAYDTYEGFQNKEDTVAVAIDLEDAYNRVSFQVLMQQLIKAEVNPYTIRWIGSILLRRTVALRLGTWVSEPVIISPGLPQGSPISPVMFNIYTADLARMSIENGRMLTFADDGLGYKRGTRWADMAQGIQRSLDEVTGWCVESNSKVNPTKAAALWCSLNNRIVNQDLPAVQISHQDIERVSEMRYLGIIMDRSLSFKAHVSHVGKKVGKALAALKIMAAYGLAQRLLFLFFQATVLSVIDYGLGQLTLSKAQLARLDVVQNEGMRTILGCPRNTSAAAMRYMLGLPSMEQRHRAAMVKALYRVARDKDHPLHQELGNEKGHRLKRGKSWMATAEDIVREVCRLEQVRLGPEWVSYPERMDQFTRVVITLGRECREQDPAVAYAEIRALIEENSRPGDVVIYTDGSVQRGTKSGWGYSARSNGSIIQEDSCSYPVTTSSMRMEVDAATAALKWVSTTGFRCALILTDSQSMLKKIEAGSFRPEWIDLIKASQLRKLVWIYTPGHAGVKGNERADHLAGSADFGEDLEMGEKEILTALYELPREEPQSDSVDRLVSLGYKEGDGRKEDLCGETRRRKNQMATGTITMPTLRWLLKWRAEQIWACPDCSDAGQ